MSQWRISREATFDGSRKQEVSSFSELETCTRSPFPIKASHHPARPYPKNCTNSLPPDRCLSSHMHPFYLPARKILEAWESSAASPEEGRSCIQTLRAVAAAKLVQQRATKASRNSTWRCELNKIRSQSTSLGAGGCCQPYVVDVWSLCNLAVS
jgi:hypothetical protein